MIRIRVEVLSTSRPLILRAEISKDWQGLPRSSEGSIPFVLNGVSGWIQEYAVFVKRAADELVPR